MGVYSNGKFYGIKIYNFIDDISNILYEEKYDEIMSFTQMREAVLFYNNLSDKQDVCFQVYTECSVTLSKYDKDNFITWQPISSQTFLEKFGI